MSAADASLSEPQIAAPAIHVSVEGPDYSESQRNAVEDEVRSLVESRLMDANRPRLQDAAPSTSELHDRDKDALEGAIDEFAKKLVASEADATAAADVVDRFTRAAEAMPLLRPVAPPTSVSRKIASDSCICISNNIPGRTLRLDSLIPEPPHPDDPTKFVIALFVDSGRPFPFPSRNAVRMEVTVKSPTPQGPNGLPYPRDVAAITLALGPNVSWAKEIVAWNFCTGRVGVVTARPGSPQRMVVRQICGGTHTIVFRKPGSFGIWFDTNNFESSQFWAVFGGTDVLFTWISE